MPGAGKTTRLAVDTNSYGDGYQHRATRGLNPARPEFSLQFPFVGASQLQEYDDFLKQYAATGFWILPPGEPNEIFVYCDEWSASFNDKNNSQGLVGVFSANFVRTFNPQPFAFPPNTYATAWRDKVIEQGGTVGTEQFNRVNRLATALDQAGVMAKLGFLYLFVAESQIQAGIDLTRQVIGQWVNSPTWAAATGVKGDAVSAHFNTMFAPAAGPNYQRTNAFHAAWVSVAPVNGGGCVSGNNDSAYSRILQNQTASPFNTTYECNSGATGGSVATPKNTGFYMAERSGENAMAGYHNNIVLQQATTPSTANNTFTHRILANITTSGTISKFSNATVAVGVAGLSLTPAERNALFNALTSYLSWWDIAP
jgi:phage-related protein